MGGSFCRALPVSDVLFLVVVQNNHRKAARRGFQIRKSHLGLE